MAGSWSNTATNLIVLIEQISGYSGIFGYSPTVGAGNLVLSITAAAGTDPYGNPYRAGVTTYGTADNITSQSSSGDTVALKADAPSYVADSTSPGIEFRKAVEPGDGASITEYDDTFDHGLLLLSPSPVVGGAGGDDFAYIQMIGRYSTDPSIQLYATGPDSFISLNQTLFDPDGVIETYAGSSWNTYTPSVTGGGSATYSTRTGWWQRIGGLVFFNAYIVVNAAGSGAGTISITTPTDIDRTTRQSIPCQVDAAAVQGSFCALTFTGGSGNVIDRIRTSTDANLIGSNLSSNAVIVVEGWYREA
jgi:hypothetical protein